MVIAAASTAPRSDQLDVLVLDDGGRAESGGREYAQVELYLLAGTADWVVQSGGHTGHVLSDDGRSTRPYLVGGEGGGAEPKLNLLRFDHSASQSSRACVLRTCLWMMASEITYTDFLSRFLTTFC